MTTLIVGLPLIDGREYELRIEGQVSDHPLGDGSGVVALSPRVPGKGPELWMIPKTLHLQAANPPVYIDGPAGAWTNRQRQSGEPSVYLQSIDPFTDKARVAMFDLEGDPITVQGAITSLWNAWAIVNGRAKLGTLTGRPLAMSDVTRKAFLAEYDRMRDEYDEEELAPPTQADIGTTYGVSDDTIRRFCKKQHPPINWPPK